MIDLNDLPQSDCGEYLVCFDNILGHCSMITIMSKDGSDIQKTRGRCLMVGFVDSVTDTPRYEWHSNARSLSQIPFDDKWIIDEWKKHRERILSK